uniref:Grammistin Pp 2a n=1 Tax=Pogonoperca punctata TaxID=160738 RepID=GRA2A_POGPU|nr:RecName: Full=Grammistin Pp 2a [Pogonoperca punctata]
FIGGIISLIKKLF